MIDAKDLTFTIPVKIDTSERLEIAILSLDLLLYHFNTNIIVSEQDGAYLKDFCKKSNITYLTSNYSDGLIRRTKMLNDMCLKSTTPYISNFDADVFIPPKQIAESLNLLRDNKADLVFPFDSICVEVPKILYTEIRSSKTIPINVFTEFLEDTKEQLHVGKCLIWNKNSFINGGMENENFISWGPEDGERIERFKKLGFRILRTGGLSFHFSHQRDENSSCSNPFYENNCKEFLKVKSMSCQEMIEYVSSFLWMKQIVIR